MSYEEIARRLIAEELKANAKGLTSQSSPEILILAHAVLEQKETIERLESGLRIEKASQATRGNN